MPPSRRRFEKRGERRKIDAEYAVYRHLAESMYAAAPRCHGTRTIEQPLGRKVLVLERFPTTLSDRYGDRADCEQDPMVPAPDFATWLDMAFQIVAAVTDLHDNIGMAHLDIKPENIVLDAQDRVYLIDFENSAPIDERAQNELHWCTIRGTEIFAAPEVLNTAFATRPYDELADTWSVGVTLLEMYSGKDMPIENIETQHDVDDALDAYDPLPAPVRDLVRACLVVNPRARPAMHDVLEHRTFRDNMTRARRQHILARHAAPF